MKRLLLGVAVAVAFSATQAVADGMPTRGRAAATDHETRPCSLSANAGFSTEKVIRGISESAEDFSVSGGFDLNCGRFYVGVAGSSVNAFGATALVDISTGFRTKTGPVAWDVGVVYHAYNANDDVLNYWELRAGASGEVWRGGTLGASVAYTPELGGSAGAALSFFGFLDRPDAWTVEGTFAQVLPNVGIFTPTVSAAVGQVNLGDNWVGLNDWTYWNIGLTLAFHEKWALDLRFHDTNIDGGCFGLCDERFVASLKYTF